MDWAEKYRPVRLADIVGNNSALQQIAQWARDWTRQSKPLLIYGKPGIGKTSCATSGRLRSSKELQAAGAQRQA
jgi:replication factor C large subunit